MTIQRQIDQLLAHRAAEWFELLRSGHARHEEFIQWIAESPRHMEEFMTVVALAEEVRKGELLKEFDKTALLRRVAPAASDIRPTLPQPETLAPTSRVLQRRWASGLAAAATALALAFLIAREDPSPWQDYSTTVGEQRAVELPDGSVMHIDAQSHVQVRLVDSTRDIRLLRGEALFKVAQDPRRPFRVLTREAVVRALGTQFNVYARASGTTISVIEGKVQVSSGTAGSGDSSAAAIAMNSTTLAALTAGEEARVTATGKIERNEHPNIASVVAWRQRRLIFEKMALEDIVIEFNRYNRAKRLRLEGIEAGSRHYSGTFDADDPESFGSFLSLDRDLVVEKTADEIIVSTSPKAH